MKFIPCRHLLSLEGFVISGNAAPCNFCVSTMPMSFRHRPRRRSTTRQCMTQATFCGKYAFLTGLEQLFAAIQQAGYATAIDPTLGAGKGKAVRKGRPRTKALQSFRAVLRASRFVLTIRFLPYSLCDIQHPRAARIVTEFPMPLLTVPSRSSRHSISRKRPGRFESCG